MIVQGPSSRINQEITNRVAGFYEQFPYPFYPLAARPYCPDAYLSSSRVLGILASDLLGYPCGVLSNRAVGANKHQVLVLGCGDSQPYLFKKWEHPNHNLSFLDLSKKSLIRARLRFGFYLRKVQWLHEDLETFLTLRGHHESRFHHVDAYGVLHHTAEPSLALKLIAKNMAPAATLKLMVYNQAARAWIHEISKVLRLCKLNPYEPYDRKVARQLLKELANLASLREVFEGLGPQIFSNEHRLCDTFFNEREVKWLPHRWISALEEAGLVPLSLVDRYGELDDLPNPMWHFPSKEQLQARCSDKRFENNLEILAVKPPINQNNQIKITRQLFPLSSSGYPHQWFSYSETKSLHNATKYELWTAFTKRFEDPNIIDRCEVYTQTKIASLQRIARLGGFFPADAKKSKLFDQMTTPLCDKMQPPNKPILHEIPGSLNAQFIKILKAKKLNNDRLMDLIVKRIVRINNT